MIKIDELKFTKYASISIDIEGFSFPDKGLRTS